MLCNHNNYSLYLLATMHCKSTVPDLLGQRMLVLHWVQDLVCLFPLCMREDREGGI